MYNIHSEAATAFASSRWFIKGPMGMKALKLVVFFNGIQSPVILVR